MPARTFPAALLTLCLLLPGLSASAAEAIYDESADAAPQIAAALVQAKQENKRVLLQFGANWCGWCHRLHQLFTKDPAIAEDLRQHYVVVLVDVNEHHNEATDQKYGKPTRFGLPAIVLLDAGGKQLTTKDTGELEEGDHHSPQKVLEFLKTEKWAEQKTPVPLLNDIDALTKRAMALIQKEHPEIKPDNLVFSGIQYSYTPAADSFADQISVQFNDSSSREEGTTEGRPTVTHRVVSADFMHDPAGRERTFVGTNGKAVQYLPQGK